MSETSLGRGVASVVVGYLAMFACVFVGMTVAYLSLGVERTFKPGSFDVSLLWVGVTIVINLIAAMVGGIVCVAIGRGRRAVPWLICLIIVLGIAFAIPDLTAPPATQTRSGLLSNLEAMQQAREPNWIAISNPIFGVIGILIGSRLKRTPV